MTAIVPARKARRVCMAGTIRRGYFGRYELLPLARRRAPAFKLFQYSGFAGSAGPDRRLARSPQGGPRPLVGPGTRVLRRRIERGAELLGGMPDPARVV